MIEKKYNCINREDKWIVKASEAFEASKMRKYYADMEKTLMSELKELSEEQNSFGGGYMFINSVRKGAVSYSKIPELKELDLEQYRGKEVVSWKLSKI